MTIVEKLGNFTLKKRIPLPEIQAHYIEFVHSTGATVIHIETEDPENTFALNFKTPPDSSNGVAHILEHIVLCGSKKYPIRDPFFSMRRRSLNTFLNALTSDVYTSYPGATLNKKDFYNLLDVYLDAVFYPNLNPLSFLQEGHRVEFQDSQDPATPLIFKGVVFNEMKGAYSDPVRNIFAMQNHYLFEGLPYQYDAGGLPEEIPDLTYEELVNFHKTYYHPSRCLFYFYGNFPLEEHLLFLEEKILNVTQSIPPLAPFPKLQRFTEPKTIERSYPVEDASQAKDYLAIGFVTHSSLDLVTTLGQAVALGALTDTDASPLKKSLLKSGLCKEVHCYWDDDVSEVPVMFLFFGVVDAQALLACFDSLIVELSRTPFDRSLIEASLHQTEIQRLEITKDRYPYSMHLLWRFMGTFWEGGEGEEPLLMHSHFKSLREQWEQNPNYFNQLFEQYFVNNPHRVNLIVKPDATLKEKQDKKEKQQLEKIKNNLSANEVKIIENEALALESLQDEEEDISCLPTLAIEDIQKEPLVYPLEKTLCGSTPVYTHHCFTNGFVYANLIVDLPTFSLEELPYVRLFSMLLTQLGTQEKNYEEMLNWVQATTGGLQSYISFYTQADNPNQCKPCLQLAGHALHRNSQDLFTLLQLFQQKTLFSEKNRIKEILLKTNALLETSLPRNAFNYSLSRAARGISIPCFLSDELYGLPWFLTLKKWVQNIDTTLPHLLQSLEQVQEKMVNQPKELVLTCEQTQYAELLKQQFYGLDALPSKGTLGSMPKVTGDTVDMEAIAIPSAISFSAQVIPTAPYSDPLAQTLSIVSPILDKKYIHKTIREKGGAYGGYSSNYTTSGYFAFRSYRDPQVSHTLKAYRDCPKAVLKEGITEEDVLEAKFDVFQDLDNPPAPGSRGITAYGWERVGKTYEMRKKVRNHLLSCTCERVVEAIDTFLSHPPAATVFIGDKTLYEKEQENVQAMGWPPLKISDLP